MTPSSPVSKTSSLTSKSPINYLIISVSILSQTSFQGCLLHRQPHAPWPLYLTSLNVLLSSSPVASARPNPVGYLSVLISWSVIIIVPYWSLPHETSFGGKIFPPLDTWHWSSQYNRGSESFCRCWVEMRSPKVNVWSEKRRWKWPSPGRQAEAGALRRSCRSGSYRVRGCHGQRSQGGREWSIETRPQKDGVYKYRKECIVFGN